MSGCGSRQGVSEDEHRLCNQRRHFRPDRSTAYGDAYPDRISDSHSNADTHSDRFADTNEHSDSDAHAWG